MNATYMDHPVSLGIAFELGGVCVPLAASNAVMMGGILRNLLSNAIKYTPPGGRILVGCRNRGPDARIDTVDTGIGIAPGHVAKILAAFKQLASTRTDGMGLGTLSTSRARQGR